MKMWIARAEDNLLHVFREKPFLLELPELKCTIWVYEDICGNCSSWRNMGERIDSDNFPEVTFENSPQEVEIVSKDELDALREKYEDFCGLVAEMRRLQREQDSADIQWDNLHYHESIYKRMVGLQEEVDQWLNLN